MRMARDTPTSHLGLLAYPSSFLGVCGASRARNMLTSCHGDLDLYPPRRNSIRTLTLPTFLLTPQTGASWIFFFFTIILGVKKLELLLSFIGCIIHTIDNPQHSIVAMISRVFVLVAAAALGSTTSFTVKPSGVTCARTQLSMVS